MLGYVKQDVYDREVAAREKAEADVAELRTQLATAQATNARLLDELSAQRQSNERQFKELLDHVAPIAKEPAPFPNDQNLFKRMTADEIMALPASSRREMQFRAHQARLARAREEQENDKAAREARDAMFSPAEQAEIRGEWDPTLGVFTTPKEEATTHATN